MQLGDGAVEIADPDGTVTERVPVYEMDDQQKADLVTQVAAREYVPTEDELWAEVKSMRKDYEPGWEAF